MVMGTVGLAAWVMTLMAWLVAGHGGDSGGGASAMGPMAAQ